MIDNEKIEQMATVISNFCDKHQYDLTEQEIDDIALDMADKGYGNVREYEKRLCDKYIEIDNLNRDYSNAFERLKSQQREIDRLTEERNKLSDTLAKHITANDKEIRAHEEYIEQRTANNIADWLDYRVDCGYGNMVSDIVRSLAEQIRHNYYKKTKLK
nr:MAG TPA: hypothetical protein [Caudoviricetes sp.]